VEPARRNEDVVGRLVDGGHDDAEPPWAARIYKSYAVANYPQPIKGLRGPVAHIK
jgi:hypothetical protein